MRFVVIAAVLLMCLPGCARIVVRPVTSVTDQDRARLEDGVYYALPRTVVTVTVAARTTETAESQFVKELREAVKTHCDTKPTPRPSFCDGSITKDSRYLAMKRQLERLGVEVTEGPDRQFRFLSVQPGLRAEPDPKRVYLVGVRGWPWQDRSVAIDLSENGLLTTAEAEVADKTVEIVVKTIDLGARIASRAITAGAPVAKAPPPDPVSEVFAFAELLLDDLNKAQDRRWGLAAGEATALSGGISVETLDRMLKEVTQLRDDIASYFRKAKVTDLSVEYSMRPDEQSQPQVLRFLGIAQDGFVEIGKDKQWHGQALPDKFKSVGQALRRIVVTVEPDQRGGNSVIDLIRGRQSNHKHARGFFYRIPGAGVVTVVIASEDGKTVERVMSLPVQIAQYGTFAALPASTRTNKATLNLYRDSGAIKNVRVTSKGIDPAVLDKLSTSAEAVQKAKIEREDELLRLERQRKILDERKKIKELEKTLAGE